MHNKDKFSIIFFTIFPTTLVFTISLQFCPKNFNSIFCKFFSNFFRQIFIQFLLYFLQQLVFGGEKVKVKYANFDEEMPYQQQYGEGSGQQQQPNQP